MTDDSTVPLFAVPDAMADGEATYVSPLTRFVYRDDMPADWGGARACVQEDGTQVLAVQRGLSREQRGEAVRRALARIHAPRHAAVILYGADMLRRATQPAQRVAHFLHQLPGMINVTPQAVAATAATTAVIGAAGGAVAISGIMDRPAFRGPYVHAVHIRLPARPLAYLGVYEPTSPNSYAGVNEFAHACGRRPNLVTYYSGWNEPFRTSFADDAAAHGAIPLVQMNPELGIQPFPGMSNLEINYQPQFGIGLENIADGAYDSYLIVYADQVAAYGRAVVISFAPEVNGNWYPWSAQPPQDYVAAWRHIVTVFRKQGADNVTWMWDVNRLLHHASGDLSQWWPGESYVTWVGVDGYYRHPQDNWATVFAPTITIIRSFTQAPLIIGETAIGPIGTEPGQLQDMYANIQAQGDLGLVWFDEDKPHLPYRLEGDPGAEAEFRRLTQPWRLQHQVPKR